MSAGIKRMLAERALLRERRDPLFAVPGDHYSPHFRRVIGELFERIDRAAPYIDGGSPPASWTPSIKLKMVFWAVMSGPNPHHDRAALIFIDQMLEKARGLWLAGLHPDPWSERPSPRGPEGQP